MRRTVGLVQGDEIAREDYARVLRESGYRVDTFSEPTQAIEAFVKRPPDLAVLDVTLGVELCSEIRAVCPRLPVAFLASSTSEEEQISGLSAGADDHLPRNMSSRLLGLRLEALLKRNSTIPAEPGSGGEVIAIGALRIDSRWSEVRWCEQPLRLSLTQYRIVRKLAMDAPEPKTADELMSASGTCVARNTVSAQVRAIRLRFRAIDPSFDNLRTERGHGYRWAP